MKTTTTGRRFSQRKQAFLDSGGLTSIGEQDQRRGFVLISR
jgi:hypothetical protein